MPANPGGEEAAGNIRWEDLRERAPLILLAVGMVIAAALLLNLTSKLTFIADEWNLLLLRQGWGPGQLLEPFNGHPIMAPAFVFKSLQEVFGMESARPMQVAATATFLFMNALLFVYLRRRVGDWGALIGTFLILFLGAAFEDLLWAFQIGYFGSLATGLAALIALDRDDHKGDVAASILLVVALTFSSVGIAFVAAGVAEWALNPRDRRKRLFVPGAAILFYAVWWIGWGRTGEGGLEPGGMISVLTEVPGFMFDAFAAGLTSLAGLATGDGSEPDQPNLIWGQLGVLLFAGLAIWRIRSLGHMPRAFAVTLAGALCFYLLLALAQDANLAAGVATERPATASRYQLPSAVFILLMASNLLKGIRLRPLALGLGGLLGLIAISGGIGLMNDEAEERWQPASAYTRATLSGIEAAAPDSEAGYTFRPGASFDVPASDYLKAVETHGSPAFSPAELRGLDLPFRLTADAALVDAAGIALSGTPPAFTRATCRRPRIGPPLTLAPGSYAVVNDSRTELALSLSRFADPPGTAVGAVLPKATAGLELPEGSLTDPWLLSFAGTGPVLVCPGSQPGT
jgi:uncharacterized membrane protein